MEPQAHCGHHLHQQGRHRDARARQGADRHGGAKEVVICTFHALGVRMMRQDGAVLGLKPQFSILDSDDVTSILKDCGGTVDAATARQWQWTISLWKNTGLNAAQAEAQAKDDSERITARIMARYEERLSAYQSVDFDDLISLPLKLLAESPRRARQVAGGAGPCAGGRIPGHQRHAVRSAQAAGGRQRRGALHRRGRRRPVDLRLARRHAGQPEAPAAGLSRSSRSSSWSRTTAPPAPSCARPTT